MVNHQRLENFRSFSIIEFIKQFLPTEYLVLLLAVSVGTASAARLRFLALLKTQFGVVTEIEWSIEKQSSHFEKRTRDMADKAPDILTTRPTLENLAASDNKYERRSLDKIIDKILSFRRKNYTTPNQIFCDADSIIFLFHSVR